MSIATLKKVTLFGPLHEKDQCLRTLQTWGGMHISSVTKQSKATPNTTLDFNISEIQKLSEKLKKAVHYLQGAQIKRAQLRSDLTRVNSQELIELVDRVLDNEDKRRRTQDLLDALAERQEALKPWGDFTFPEGEHIGGQRLWFYLLPRKHQSVLAKLQLPWQIIHRSQQQLWLVLIAAEEPPRDILPCDRVHTGRFSLSELQNQHELLEAQLEDIEAERQKLTRHLAQLNLCQAQAQDITDFVEAQKLTEEAGKLFVVHGWIADNQVSQLREYSQANHLAWLCQSVSEQDQPPTLLSNPNLFQGGELLVNFYQTPAYRSWDPAISLFISFSLFFAMIMSDAGYAAVMLGAVLLGWQKLNRSHLGRLLRPLLLSVTVLSCLWGVLVGSYFGVELAVDNPLTRFKVFDLNNFDLMMTISVGCGILHLLVANAQQIWVAWPTGRAMYHLGWLLLLVAAPLLALNWSQATTLYQASILGCVVAGLLIFGFASDRPIKSPVDIVWRGLLGLKALTDVTNLFGDVLSYLRLFALGLASSSLALTFNDLADKAFAAEGGFGILSGLIILIVGHGLNVFLGIVSGVVHGLRLNFIEFYKWALYGEGYPFRAFNLRVSAESK